MSTLNASMAKHPHIALLPSAGMGHLMPVLRLAAMLASSDCSVTVITPHPTVSTAESEHLTTFFADHPMINRSQFQIPPRENENASAPGEDPFFRQFHSVIRSAHLLRPILASLSPPISAVFVDLAAAAGVGPVAAGLSIPYYVVSTTSARFFSVMAALPHLELDTDSEFIRIPSLSPFDRSVIPPPLFDPDAMFKQMILRDSRSLPNAKGIVLNIFDYFDPETIRALNSGEVVSNLPPVFPIGPMQPYKTTSKSGDYLPWLNSQPSDSVVYVSFGSRTAMSAEQICEIGEGLLRSKQRFLWALKSTKVDKEDSTGVGELLGDSFISRSENRGIVIKGWVNQEEILSHPAIGGFVSHCGWNSVMEAARLGVAVLAWPLHGDQRVNAEAAEKAGLVIWEKSWGWIGEKLVSSEEIADMVVKLMKDEKFRVLAKRVGEEAVKAWDNNGSSAMALQGLIQSVSLNTGN